MSQDKPVSGEIIGAKRPERKASGEWAKHLRPRRKKAFWRNTRRSAKRADREESR